MRATTAIVALHARSSAMFGIKRVVIAQYQRGLEFRDGRLKAILDPGVYRSFDPLGRKTLLIEDVSQPEANFAKAEIFVRENPQLVAGHLQLVSIGENEVGLVRKDGKLSSILAPGARQVYWTGPVAVEIERIDIGADCVVPDRLIRALQTPGAASLVREAAASIVHKEVAQSAVGLLFVGGKLDRVLAPGVYGFWKFQRNVQVDVVDTRLTAVEVSGQEILTRDKVSVRVNLCASYRIVDAVAARTQVADYKDALYRELQFGLRQAIGTRTLDVLLANKGELDGVIADTAREKLAGFGIALESAGVKDLILPGEMKEILNQVVQAEKAAQANVIKRREETAATRSLLNTARLLDESPVLLRLKELETLEKVTEKIDKLTVFGGLEGVLSNLVSIRK
jgi:regulator of protease activity HflC (stomatin/prohibitin superfamily)